MENPSLEKKSTGRRIASYAAVIFFLISLFFYYRRHDFQKFFTDIRISWKLKPYEQDVMKCVAQEQSKLNKDQKVLGLEYSCAIKTTAVLYTQDEQLAIALCMKYRPFTVEDSIQFVACQSSIKKAVERMSTGNALPSSLPTSAPAQKPAGVSYENTKYGYSFVSSRGTRIFNSDDSEPDLSSSKNILIFDAKDNFLFAVKALDPEPLRQYPLFKETIEHYNLSLSQFAQLVEGKNMFGKNLIMTSTEMVSGQTVYEFWFDGELYTDSSGEALEPRKQVVFYMKPKNIILQVRFPAGSDVSEKIFTNLTFLANSNKK
mgnify:CR=1 FL=1